MSQGNSVQTLLLLCPVCSSVEIFFFMFVAFWLWIKQTGNTQESGVEGKGEKGWFAARLEGARWSPTARLAHTYSKRGDIKVHVPMSCANSSESNFSFDNAQAQHTQACALYRPDFHAHEYAGGWTGTQCFSAFCTSCCSLPRAEWQSPQQVFDPWISQYISMLRNHEDRHIFLWIVHPHDKAALWGKQPLSLECCNLSSEGRNLLQRHWQRHR